MKRINVGFLLRHGIMTSQQWYLVVTIAIAKGCLCLLLSFRYWNLSNSFFFSTFRLVAGNRLDVGSSNILLVKRGSGWDDGRIIQIYKVLPSHQFVVMTFKSINNKTLWQLRKCTNYKHLEMAEDTARKTMPVSSASVSLISQASVKSFLV